MHFIYSTKKVVGITTISRVEHATAQTRELACIKDVLPQVLQRGMFTLYMLNYFEKTSCITVMYMYCTYNTGLHVCEVARLSSPN